MGFWRSAWTLVILLALASEAQSKSISISGWPIPESIEKEPPSWFGSDPVLGRLACPSLTRFNLKKSVSEPLILKSVKATEVGKKTSWRLRLRTGIYWWSGAEVTLADVHHFLSEERIRKVISRWTGSIRPVPGFEVAVEGDELHVHWSAPPPVGPFVLNGLPFWRQKEGKSGGLTYECAGIYSFAYRGDHLAYFPSRNYRQAKYDLRFYENRQENRKTRIEFQPAFPFWNLRSKNSINPRCETRVPLPIQTAISWNPKGPATKNHILRQFLVEALPLEAILGTGTKGLVGRGPVPSRHPGAGRYPKRKSLDLTDLGSKLDQLGFGKRDDRGGRVIDGAPVELTIARVDERYDLSLVEKLIGDMLSSLGIHVRFLQSAFAGVDHERVDGVLFLARSPFPHYNLLPSFHSRAKSNFPYSIPDPALDQNLEKHLGLVTNGAFDPSLLAKIDESIAKQNVFTPISDHTVCLKGLKKARSLSVRDPDWFKRTILW